uniref:Uncharacterized protein n=1 Tax=Neospora caninum (strain Liverpool) TaxID=572307 RepID=A0A0F7UHU3_NEOCL|nr:TPA: hypothetical protein BN1204_035990 [Neospora caninum Liverpool]
MALSPSPLSTQALAKSRATLAGLDESLVGEKKDSSRPEVIELADGIKLSISPSTSSLLEDENADKLPPPVKIEKVVNAWGSAAGAGSDFFDRYRQTRNVELKRLEEMEADWRKKVEAEEFQLQRHRRIVEAQEKNRAARERRRKRKLKKAELRSAAKGGERRLGPQGLEEEANRDGEEDGESEGETEGESGVRSKRSRAREEARDTAGDGATAGASRSPHSNGAARSSASPAADSEESGERQFDQEPPKRRKEEGSVESGSETRTEQSQRETSEQAEHVEKMRPGMVSIKDDEW